MRSQVLLALALGECFERQQWHSGFIKPVDVCRHARRTDRMPVDVCRHARRTDRMPGEPTAMPGEPTTCGSCRPVAREETFYEFEADVAIVAVG